MSSFFNFFADKMHLTLESYSRLESLDFISTEMSYSENEHEIKDVLTTKDGGLVTYLEIKGASSIVGEENYVEIIIDLVNNLKGSLNILGYEIQLTYSKSPELSKKAFSQSISAMNNTAKRLQLNTSSHLSAEYNTLIEQTTYERILLCLTTHPSRIDKKFIKQALQDKLKELKKYNLWAKQGDYCQNPFVAIPELRENHVGFVNAFFQTLKDHFIISRISGHKAIQYLKEEVNFRQVSQNYRPLLTGDQYNPRLTRFTDNEHDLSHLMHPTICSQIFQQTPVVTEDPTLIRIGDIFYSTILVDSSPCEIFPFSFFKNKINKNIPFRLSIRSQTGHEEILTKIRSKRSTASFLNIFDFFSEKTKEAKNAAELFLSLGEDETLLTTQICVTTWANSIEEIRKRKSLISVALQNWGDLVIKEESNDQIEAFTNGLTGFSSDTLTTVFPIGLSEVFSLYPIEKAASPYEQGNIAYISKDDTYYPVQTFSSMQSYSFTYIYAASGGGKSVLLGNISKSFILKAGLTTLPRLVNIDIGHSSSLFIKRLKYWLPENQKHLAQSFRWRLSKDFIVNAFDTTLGCEFPLSPHKNFLVNFLTELLTPAGAKKGEYPLLAELASSIIDEMYLYKSRDKSPESYNLHINKTIDDVLAKENYQATEDSIWWEVVDFLYERGYEKEAEIAQRYAMPTLNDITTVIVNSQNIQDTFARKLGIINIVDLAKTMISSVIRDLPTLAGYTNFDIGIARIISIDLFEVAKKGSSQANKQTAIFYFLARHLGCKEFYNHKDLVSEIPEKYQEHYRQKLEYNKDIVSALYMDEFHRTSESPSISDQVLVDVREGRKSNVEIILLSQRLNDANKDLLGLANNIYILSPPRGEDEKKEVKGAFGVSKDGMKAMEKHLVDTTPERGSSFLYIADIKGIGRIEQPLRLKIPPSFLWAINTTKEDNLLLDKLESIIGYDKSLKILSKEFYYGGAKNYIETRKLTMKDDQDIYTTICKELIEKHKSLINSQ